MTPHHKCPYHKWTKDDPEIIKRCFDNGFSPEDVAHNFKVTLGALILFCKRNGIQMGYKNVKI